MRFGLEDQIAVTATLTAMRPLLAVLLVIAIGCGSVTETALQPNPAPTSASTVVATPTPTPTPIAEPTPILEPTAVATPVPTPTPTVEPAPPPASTPTAEPTPDRCPGAVADLLRAETEAEAAAEGIDRYLNRPEPRRLEGLPDQELDGSHVARHQALLTARGLTGHLLDDEEMEVVGEWQSAWAVAESFGDNAEWWDAAADAAVDVVRIGYERFKSSDQVPIAARVALLSAAVAQWRADWLRALAADSGELVSAHSEALDAARGGYSTARALITGDPESDLIAATRFVAPLSDALRDRREAANRVELNC